MNATIRRRFDQLEAVRHRIEARIDGIAPATLNRQPEPGRWSAAQIVGHIIKAESLSISYIGKKVSDPANLRRAGFKQLIKSILVVAAMRVPIRIPAPDVVAEVPDNENPVELRERWMKSRGDLRVLLETIPDTLLASCLYKHPVGGPMTLEWALAFMVAHATRHAKQIDRALRSLDG